MEADKIVFLKKQFPDIELDEISMKLKEVEKIKERMKKEE